MGTNECDSPAQQAGPFVCKKGEFWVLATACELQHEPLQQPTEEQVTPPPSSLFSLLLLNLALFSTSRLGAVSKTERRRTFHSFSLFSKQPDGEDIFNEWRRRILPSIKEKLFLLNLIIFTFILVVINNNSGLTTKLFGLLI